MIEKIYKELHYNNEIAKEILELRNKVDQLQKEANRMEQLTRQAEKYFCCDSFAREEIFKATELLNRVMEEYVGIIDYYNKPECKGVIKITEDEDYSKTLYLVTPEGEELELEYGDILEVLDTTNDKWIKGEINSYHYGYVVEYYVGYSEKEEIDIEEGMRVMIRR